MIRWLGFAAGIVLIAVSWVSVIKSFMIPRETRIRLNQIVFAGVYWAFRIATTRMHDLVRRERLLAMGGPVFLLSLLTSWLTCLWFGFALLLWTTGISFTHAMRESGSSLFTLGFAAPRGPDSSVIVFLAAASGVAVLALLIAYLPLLYAAFNRRETLVTTLEALAGAPPWGPELLARQALIPSSAPHEARPLLRVGYTTLRRLAASVDLAVPDDPAPTDPIDLTREDFDDAVRWLHQAGWQTERLADDAWPHFHGWRVNYEAAVYKLTYHLDLPPALWPGFSAAWPAHRGSAAATHRPQAGTGSLTQIAGLANPARPKKRRAIL